MNKIDLEEMKAVDIKQVKPETLVDIKDIKIDTSLSKEERLVSFMEQVKNPFCFLCEGFIVKTQYSDHAESLQSKLTDLMMIANEKCEFSQ